MSYYSERNGLAKWWDKDHARIVLARWVFHHPDRLLALIEKLKEYGIDLIGNTSDPNNDASYNISIFVEQLGELTREDIDKITGVDLDAE